MTDALSLTAQWGLPALVTPVLRITLGHEAWIAAVAGLLAAVALLVERENRTGLALAKVLCAERERRAPMSAGTRVAAWIIVGLCALVALPWLAVTDPQGLGFRLRIAAFVPMALAAAIALRLVVGSLPAALATRVTLALALVLALRTPGRRMEGAVMTHPALVTSAYALASHVPADAVAIVPERHIAFMITWYTRLPTSIRPEGIAPARRVRVMPLGVFIQIGSPLDDALLRARTAAHQLPPIDAPIGLHPRHPNGLVMVTERTWDWLLAQLHGRAHDHWAAWPTI